MEYWCITCGRPIQPQNNYDDQYCDIVCKLSDNPRIVQPPVVARVDVKHELRGELHMTGSDKDLRKRRHALSSGLYYSSAEYTRNDDECEKLRKQWIIIEARAKEGNKPVKKKKVPKYRKPVKAYNPEDMVYGTAQEQKEMAASKRKWSRIKHELEVG